MRARACRIVITGSPAVARRVGSTEGPRLFVAILNNAVIVLDEIVGLENLLQKNVYLEEIHGNGSEEIHGCPSGQR